MEKLSIQKNIAWNTIGSVVYMATQWLITILVVRIAGVTVAGNFTLAVSVNNIFYSIAMFGIRNYQVSDVTNKYSNGAYTQSRMISCIGSFLLCFCYSLIISYSTEQRICIAIYCIFKMTEAFYDVFAGMCQKAWRMDYIGKSWLIRGIVTFAGFVLTLMITKNLPVSLAVMAAVSLLMIFVYDIPRTSKLTEIHIKGETKNGISLMKECFPLLCYMILSTLIPTIPRLFLERIEGSYALGIYGSVSAPTTIVQMGASYVFNPFMTLFAEQYEAGNIKGFMNTLRKCAFWLAVISVVSLIGGKILGYWGLNLLYGAEVAEYVDLLEPLILCTIFTAFAWLLCGLLTVVRDFKGLILSNLIPAIVSFLASSLLIQTFGTQGTSYTLMIGLCLECGFLFFFLMRKLKEKGEANGK